MTLVTNRSSFAGHVGWLGCATLVVCGLLDLRAEGY